MSSGCTLWTLPALRHCVAVSDQSDRLVSQGLCSLPLILLSNGPNAGGSGTRKRSRQGPLSVERCVSVDRRKQCAWDSTPAAVSGTCWGSLNAPLWLEGPPEVQRPGHLPSGWRAPVFSSGGPVCPAFPAAPEWWVASGPPLHTVMLRLVVSVPAAVPGVPDKRVQVSRLRR